MHTSQEAGRLGVMQATSRVLLTFSDDDGVSWDPTPTVVFEQGTGSFLRAPVLAAHDDPNEMILGMYFTPSGEFERKDQCSAVLRSTNGRSWSKKTVIPGTEGAVGVQPAIVRVNGPHLL